MYTYEKTREASHSLCLLFFFPLYCIFLFLLSLYAYIVYMYALNEFANLDWLVLELVVYAPAA